MPQLDRVVAEEHISERCTFQGIPDPEPVRPIDITEHEMASSRDHPIGEDNGPSIDIEGRRIGDAGRRRVENDGRRSQRRLPERRFSCGEGIRRARER